MSHPGDRCPKGCPGKLRIRTSKRVGNSFEQRMECNACGADGGKRYVEGELRLAPKRI